ncbi:UDP-3-O-acyl-N-acetylglucosamine deacetylase [Rhodobacter sphaeroides]|uniref:UDP-3-O-acyl-N-acetylglucosamine deacetylase n=2 Tax=Cereibacter sphaeroides TaxID=1063 RepID=Q3J4L4_CERS4|nr:UDP-3-O-acyl-N-acetylglucosamine deacetylase [Cereibacter sphaeroides]ABN75902.1 UDP-3-O-[3-hydroxymyristoyl] N-acetylglucosamine deacetylase [Cereibacter sphaeroides ATCC 17029]EKX58618.1 UDP-3-O-[3-hydroxymyristoyl] N-acetylglucosamine deacetylase [Rhodobacter sp. AKP1]ABA78270.1 UDP-3-O-(3-hydroxymyristoyl) N-acetylglucosamine deacetylase [Cereibacter sphaeroides 2.4.1]AMJ46629.1 UDP-3-O-[3-hydroxymyristoyl] N-acetylglucosamine deacetylase [Cereibacter sphaeroides]ANS33342.1 UDP-3-O-[3-h
MQSTLKSAAKFTGVGLHSGEPVRMVVKPASADYGIWFRRVDVTSGDALIPARWDAVVPSRLCTLIANPSGVTVSTIEHVMAALAGCGIHNALIEIDGPEVPILDGSSVPFVEAFLARGIREQAEPVRAIRILEPVEVREGEAVARLEPADDFEIDFSIEFAEAAIGRQEKSLNMANGAFVRELCDSRTFCRQADVDAMRANGLALGGTFENAVVFEGDRILSPGGLRHADEPVRHKMLDALGDLSLAGGPIIGRYTGIRAGHALTNRLLRTLFARRDAFRLVDCGLMTGCKLPGVGVHRSDVPALR